VTLHYRWLRGGHGSTARLAWQPGADGYTLSLSSDGPPSPPPPPPPPRGTPERTPGGFIPSAAAGPGTGLGPGAASRGRFDAAGLAPERFVDRRRGRDVRAANFQRDHDSVSFSGGAAPAPLQSGMQDRLSWMLQLSAVLQANPALSVPGAEVSMWVAGARGGAQVWTFRVVGSDDLLLAGGQPLAALHLQRLAAFAYDMQVDVWVDPTRHHLPVRTRLATPPGEWASELLWIAPPPVAP
jgi:hypothetical protein